MLPTTPYRINKEEEEGGVRTPEPEGPRPERGAFDHFATSPCFGPVGFEAKPDQKNAHAGTCTRIFRPLKRELPSKEIRVVLAAALVQRQSVSYRAKTTKSGGRSTLELHTLHNLHMRSWHDTRSKRPIAGSTD